MLGKGLTRNLLPGRAKPDTGVAEARQLTPAYCAATAAEMPPPLRSKVCRVARTELGPAAKRPILQYAPVGVSRDVERVVQMAPGAMGAPSQEMNGEESELLMSFPPSSKIVAEMNSGFLSKFTT